MQGKQRKVVQAVSYELLALIFVAPLATWVFGSSLLQSGLVALAISLVAVSWNMLFNAQFLLLLNNLGEALNGPTDVRLLREFFK